MNKIFKANQYVPHRISWVMIPNMYLGTEETLYRTDTILPV